MTRMLRVLPLLLAFAACTNDPAPQPPPPPPTPPPPGQLLGTLLIESATGEPAPAVNARLTLFPTGRSTRTDATGSFAFEGLSAGSYVLRCEVDVDADGVIDVGINRAIELSANGAEVSGVDLGGLVLARLGSVEGIVRVGDAAAPGVLVALMPNGAGAGGERLAATDIDGRFVFDRVLPGDWTVEAIAPAAPPSSARATALVAGGGIARVVLELAPVEEQATLFGIVRTPPGAPELIDITVSDGADDVAHVETAPGDPFEVDVPTGVYTVVIRSRNTSLAPTAVANLPIVGRTELRADGALILDEGHDLNGDGVPAPTDTDDDGDGCVDAEEPESTRFDARSCADADGDGLGDGLDLDDDGDGELDALDDCPLRFDPPALDVRPSACAAYAEIGLVASTVSEARVGVPFDVFAHVVEPLGGVDVELVAQGPADAEPAAIEPTGEDRWSVTLATPGTWTLRIHASDAFRDETSEHVVVVDAPPIAIESAALLQGAVDAGIELVAVTPEPLPNARWSWEVLEGASATLEPIGDGRALFVASLPGSYVVRVTVDAGVRSGSHDIAIDVVAPALVVVPPEGDVVTTIGVPAPVEAALAVPEPGVSWTWTVPDGVTLVESSGATALVRADAPGTYTLTVQVQQRAREGVGAITLVVRPVGVVALSVATPSLDPGEEATFHLVTAPLLEDAVFTLTPDGENPAGADLRVDGDAVTFSTENTGTYTFTVDAVAGRMLARGSFSIVVGDPPLALDVLQTPRPIVVVGTPVTLVASSPDATDGTWSWSAKASNPGQPQLSGRDTSRLTFTPTTTGRYAFDLSVTQGERTGSRMWTVEVIDPPQIPVGVYWANGFVGGAFTLFASQGESLAGVTWSWEEDAGNPAALGIAGRTTATVTSTSPPSIAGTYRFTARATAGARSGTCTVVVEIAEDDPSHLPLSIAVRPVEGTVGFPSTLEAVAPVSNSVLEVQWRADASNPASATLIRADELLTVTAPLPGRYRFHADGFVGDRTGTASVEFVVHPQVPLELSATPTVPIVSSSAQLLATTPDTSGTATYAWTLTTRPAGGTAPSFSPNRNVSNPRLTPRLAGEHVLTVDVTIGVRKGRQTLTFTAQPPLPSPTGINLPSPLVNDADTNPDGLVVAVGKPITVPVLCPECVGATWTYTQSEGPTVAITNEGSRMTFVPPSAGRYTFNVRADGPSYIMNRGITLTATATAPDVYIDGNLGLLVNPDQFAGRGAWFCGSGRSDVASVTWEHVSGGIDGGEVVDGSWLYFTPRSYGRRVTAWRCTVRTTGGATFTRTQPAIVVPRSPHRVFFLSPDAPTNGPGTLEAPTSNMNLLVWSCFVGICFGDPTGNLVLFSGTYPTTSLTGQGMAHSVVGSVDPVTFEQDPVAHPSVIEWRDTQRGGLWPSPIEVATHLDGVDMRFLLRPGATMPPYLIGLGNGSRISRSSIRAIGAGEAVPLFAVKSDRSNPPQLVGNHFLLRGVAGPIVADNCRGLLVANNAFDVDAASTGPAIQADCSVVATQVPSQIVNNVFYQRNGAPALDLWGSPASDSGHVVGGNWFSGTGRFAVAAYHAGGPLSVGIPAVNAGRLQGGLDGGGNTTDPSCFPADPGNASWGVRLVPGSSCSTGGVRPNPVYAPDLGLLGTDVDGDTVDVTAWLGGQGTIAIGPDQQVTR